MIHKILITLGFGPIGRSARKLIRQRIREVEHRFHTITKSAEEGLQQELQAITASAKVSIQRIETQARVDKNATIATFEQEKEAAMNDHIMQIFVGKSLPQTEKKR